MVWAMPTPDSATLPVLSSPELVFSDLLRDLGVPHAFTARRGGVSAGIFESLNFGNPGDLPQDQRDPMTNIRQNIARVLSAIGAAGREVVEVHQVHGPAVHEARRGGPSHAGPNDTKADALITDDPARIAAVRIADCAPILLASVDGSTVAAVHAGWRGVVLGVLPAAIERMRSIGVAGEIVAAVGPCIGRDAFEVSDDVAIEFRKVFGERTPHVRAAAAPGKHLIDMKAALAEQLAAAGASRIDILPHCTVLSQRKHLAGEGPSGGGGPMFFSHRRDGGRTGRMMAMIGPKGR
jgi:YfiH family protein